MPTLPPLLIKDQFESVMKMYSIYIVDIFFCTVTGVQMCIRDSLMAAFLLWENTAGTGGKTVTATSDGTIRWVDFNVSYEALCKAYEMCIRDRLYGGCYG